MADKKLIEVSLKKSYASAFSGSLNSALFQDICETALECISENEKFKERLQISPQGDDKIDELEQTIEHYKFQMEEVKQHNDILFRFIKEYIKRFEGTPLFEDGTHRMIVDKTTLEEAKESLIKAGYKF